MSLSIPATASAQDMRLDEFLEKAERLERRGPLALLSSDFGLLKDEVEASAALYRNRIASDRAAGRTPHSCPPEQGSARLSSDDVLSHLRSYPASRRPSITIRRAFFDMMAQRYPCN
ncbi:hypothetical protein AAW01_13185 [Aurantiacibacter gangjinensis]|uniref:Rap1a immunity protein domain-containing protein n=2 Tax=Aurantiacibacter gangjinensis TaxID=502682 RepID=A0A0G9MKK8_9SPHN|nr:hypothetical protein AAW01_13185 [Aurantiacibacter gangjinensis]